MAGMLLLNAERARAQAGMPGVQISGAMEKLFGEHKAFSAALELQTEGGPTGPITITGFIANLNQMSRFEMDLSKIQSASVPAAAIAQMKQMGMDKMVMIAIPDKKTVLMEYPSMKAYVEMPLPDEGSTKMEDYKIELTELGAETVAGHPCVKNKSVVTGPDGVKHESTVWYATDMDKFPVKIEVNENETKIAMIFKDVKLEKPAASQFAAPTNFQKYESMTSLMMSKMKVGQGAQ